MITVEQGETACVTVLVKDFLTKELVDDTEATFSITDYDDVDVATGSVTNHGDGTYTGFWAVPSDADIETYKYKFVIGTGNLITIKNGNIKVVSF